MNGIRGELRLEREMLSTGLSIVSEERISWILTEERDKSTVEEEESVETSDGSLTNRNV